MTNEQWLAKEQARKERQAKLLAKYDELDPQIDKTQPEWWRQDACIAQTQVFRELMRYTNEKGEVVSGKY